jgi:hypothetical protein
MSLAAPSAAGCQWRNDRRQLFVDWRFLGVDFRDADARHADALHLHSGNTVTVYWQDTSGWNLQQNSNLAVTNGWSTSGGFLLSNGTNYLDVVSPTVNLFFRLSHR